MNEHDLQAAAEETGIPADVLAGYIEAGCTVAEAVECEAAPPLERVTTIAHAAVQRRGRGWMGNGSGMIESRRLPNPVNGFTYCAEIALLRGFDGAETNDVIYACQWLGNTPADAYERSLRAAREVADYAGYSFHHVRADEHVCPKCTAAMDGPARACEACLEALAAPVPAAPPFDLAPARIGRGTAVHLVDRPRPSRVLCGANQGRRGASVARVVEGEADTATCTRCRAFLPQQEQAPAAPPSFDPARVRSERHRASVTQGDCSLYYGDRLLGRFGDDIRIITATPGSGGVHWDPSEVRAGDGRQVLAGWAGLSDAQMVDVARTVLARETPTGAPPPTPSGSFNWTPPAQGWTREQVQNGAVRMPAKCGACYRELDAVHGCETPGCPLMGHGPGSAARVQVRVPPTFWQDCVDVGLDVGAERCRSARGVDVECTPEQLENLRDRARYYAEDGPDACPPGIIASARATLKRLADQVPVPELIR